MTEEEKRETVVLTKEDGVMSDIRAEASEKARTELLSKSFEEVQEFYKTHEHVAEEMVENAEAQFEEYKKKYQESLEVVLPNVTPIGMYVVTTARLKSLEEAGRFLLENEFSVESIGSLSQSVAANQQVVAVGTACQDVSIGDEVIIALENFTQVRNPNSVNRMEINYVPAHTIKGREYLVIGERDIKFIDGIPKRKK